MTDVPKDGVLRDLVFAERQGFRPLTLDLHLPAGSDAPPPPVILFIHGGGWRRGSRRAFAPGISVEESFARITAAGFAVASADYRLSGEARFPAQLDDVHAAIDWLRARGAAHGLDAERVVLWGESSGAHLAALAALTRPEGIAGVVDWYGPADLTRLGSDLHPEDPAVFDDDPGTREAELIGGPIGSARSSAAAASPALQVREGAPPFLLAHGTDDDLVPFAQSARFAEALRTRGVHVELEPVAGGRHFWHGVADIGPLFDSGIDFARRVLGAVPDAAR